MRIKINKYQAMDEAATELVVKVHGFLTAADLQRQIHSRDSVLTLLERKAKELARKIEEDGPAVFMGWKQ